MPKSCKKHPHFCEFPWQTITVYPERFTFFQWHCRGDDDECATSCGCWWFQGLGAWKLEDDPNCHQDFFRIFLGPGSTRTHQFSLLEPSYVFLDREILVDTFIYMWRLMIVSRTHKVQKMQVSQTIDILKDMNVATGNSCWWKHSCFPCVKYVFDNFSAGHVTWGHWFHMVQPIDFSAGWCKKRGHQFHKHSRRHRMQTAHETIWNQPSIFQCGRHGIYVHPGTWHLGPDLPWLTRFSEVIGSAYFLFLSLIFFYFRGW